MRSSLAPAQRGQHPHVGAIDVVPLVYLDASSARRRLRGGARARRPDRRGAGGAGVPLRRATRRLRVRRTRAELRRGGCVGPRTSAHAATGSCARTSGRRGCIRRPARRSSPRARRWSRSTSSSRRPATVADARADRRADPRGRHRGAAGAARDRRRAAPRGVAQVSMNVERPYEVPLARGRGGASRGMPTSPAPSSSGSRRAPRSTGFPADVCRSAASTPPRQLTSRTH